MEVFRAPDFSEATEKFFESYPVTKLHRGKVSEILAIIAGELSGLTGKEITAHELAKALLKGKGLAQQKFPTDKYIDVYAFTLLSVSFSEYNQWIVDLTKKDYLDLLNAEKTNEN